MLTRNVILRDFITAMRASGNDRFRCFDYLTKIEKVIELESSDWERTYEVVVNHHDEDRYMAYMTYATGSRNVGDDDSLPPTLLEDFEYVYREDLYSGKRNLHDEIDMYKF